MKAVWALCAVGTLNTMLGLGCRASVSAKVSSSGETIRPDASKSGSEDSPDDLDSESQEQHPAEVEYSLCGARPDLRLASQSLRPTCHCLTVVVGQPDNPAFLWHSQVPVTDPSNQVVIAFSSEGISCSDAPAGAPGASYWGYLQEGEDVVVVVENATFGRPLTQGAIIPRPAGSGKIYIRPLNDRVPYGRSLDGSGRACLVNLPDSQ